jgi:FkbM family methyltransferase
VKKLIRGMRAIMSLFNPSAWGPFLHAWDQTRFNHDFSVSFSQGGEDLALIHLLDQKPGRYLDIGAHHPDRFSNTRLLYDRGWSGINVEANPNLIPELKRKRPRDLTIGACVGSKSEYIFTLFKEPAISTANQDWKKKFLEQEQIIDSEIKITGISLSELITKNFSSGDLDLLLVDAEGSDFDVIQSGNFENLPVGLFPKWILVETPRPLFRALQEETVKYLQGFDYEPILILPMSTILKKI